MKKFIGVSFGVAIISLTVMFCFSVFGTAIAQTKVHTLKDFGLTEESVKYLSAKEIQDILNSKTPEETKIEMDKLAKSQNASSTPNPLTILAPTLYQNGTAGVPVGTVNCFDYYHFGSVQTDISSQSSNVVPGMVAQFSGTVTNNNSYPVVGGTLYVKIFKEKGLNKDSNGPDVVDQFIAVDNISISASSTTEVSFPWKVPMYARGGNYRLATFFVTDKKFNLLGLSFTDDVVGNVFDFTIENNDSAVYFDKSSVTINNSRYYFAAFPPKIEDKDSASVSAKIINNTDKNETVNIIWKLYRWDGMGPSNLINTTSTTSLVKSHSLSVVKITVTDKEYPVYLLVGEMTYKDTKSIINIRYVRSGVDRVRLNFPSITQFPIVAGAASTMFSCVHNSGSSALVSDSKLVLELKDNNGSIVDTYTYNGGITGEMMAVKKDFVSPKDLDNFSLHAVLYQAGKVVDESNIVYDCNVIDPSKCNPKKGNGGVLATVFGIIGLILVSVGYGIYKKKMSASAKIILLALLFLPIGFISSTQVAEAKSVSWNIQQDNLLMYFWNRVFSYGGGDAGWAAALGPRNVTINYNTEIRNAVTNELISDGSNVPVGTDLILKFLPHVPEDIYWFGTGYTSDSPYGEWRPELGHNLGILCLEKDFVGNGNVNNFWGATLTFGIYIPLVVAPPIKTIQNTDNMSCTALSGNDTDGYSMQCKVTSSGLLNPKFYLDSTVGRYYYRYYDGVDGTWNNEAKGCFGNNIPLYDNVNLSQPDQNRVYVLSVPAQTVEYNLNAIEVGPENHPPTIPMIGGTTGGQPNIDYTYNLVSTDPDGDQIKYGIDWSEPSDGFVDQWLPASGYVNSGISPGPTTKRWATVGTHSFKAIAYDEHGAFSPWAVRNVVISNSPSPSPSPSTSGSPSPSPSPSSSSGPGGGWITGLCLVNSSAITPVVNSGDKIIFTLSGLTGGSGSYSYKWEDGVSVGSVLSTTNKYEIPGAVAGVAYAINVTIADSNNPVNVKTIYCSIVSVNSVSSLLDLKIGPTIPAANDVIFRVRKGDHFALSWINSYPALPALQVDCTASISNEDSVDWDTWKSEAIKGNGSNTYDTANAIEGDHIFTLSCGKGLVKDIIKKVTLQVYSVSGGEI